MSLKFGWDSKPEMLPLLIKELVILHQACQVQYLKLKAGIIFIQSIMHCKSKSRGILVTKRSRGERRTLSSIGAGSLASGERVPKEPS